MRSATGRSKVRATVSSSSSASTGSVVFSWVVFAVCLMLVVPVALIVLSGVAGASVFSVTGVSVLGTSTGVGSGFGVPAGAVSGLVVSVGDGSAFAASLVGVGCGSCGLVASATTRGRVFSVGLSGAVLGAYVAR